MKTAEPTNWQGKDETMNSKSLRILTSCLLVALAIGAVFAGSVTASPAWKFESVELKGKETELTVGFGVKSILTVPSVPVECEHFIYKMKVSDESGTGKGEVTELPLFNCTTKEECTVKAVAAEKLPWPAHLMTGKSGGNYIVVENVKISILYGGALCALEGVSVPVTGSAGALFENASETAVFDKASFEETKTGLKALGSPVLLEGAFPTEAFEWHREQALSVS